VPRQFVTKLVEAHQNIIGSVTTQHEKRLPLTPSAFPRWASLGEPWRSQPLLGLASELRIGRTSGSTGTYSAGAPLSPQAIHNRPQLRQNAALVHAFQLFSHRSFRSSGRSCLAMMNHSSERGSSAFQEIVSPHVQRCLATPPCSQIAQAAQGVFRIPRAAVRPRSRTQDNRRETRLPNLTRPPGRLTPPYWETRWRKHRPRRPLWTWLLSCNMLNFAIDGSVTSGEVTMATKDKNSSKSNLKKPAQKTLKEKRQAKKAKT
jgi:hypothetical protein